MKRLALVTMLSFVTLVWTTGATAPTINARAGAAGASRLPLQAFIPPAANRIPHGGQPSGRFLLANASRGEIPGLRTRTSRTYATGDGNFIAKIATQPINYLDASGHWQPIDNTLVPTAGGFRNKGNVYRLSLPTRLRAGPIRVSVGSAWIEYELLGADAAGVVAGPVETYANALPGVTLKVAARDNAVKESLILGNSQTPQRFIYRLRTSPGLRAAQQASEIAFFDTSGAVAFTIAAPTIQDSAGVKGSISQRLVETAAGAQVELSVPSSWLTSTDRKWPLVIDPTVSIPGSDCYITSSSPNQACLNKGGYDDQVGWDDKYSYRTLLQFNLSAIPANSQVLNADLNAMIDGGPFFPAVSLGAYQVTHSWTSSATWNKYDGTASWATAGGDFNPTAAYVTTFCGYIDCNPSQIDWYPTQLVQGWINGTIANYGVILKEPVETVVGTWGIQSPPCIYDPAQCWGPTLNVVYEPWTGKQRFFTFDSHKLTDRLDLAVNVANGNLVFHANDFSIHGTGLDLTLDRWYNSQADSKAEFGSNWVLGTGRDVGLVFYKDGSAAYFGPSGYQIPFIKNANGTFTAPTGIDATLTQNSDGTFTFLAHKNGTKENFSAGGLLTSEVDQNGNKISFAYNADNTLASIIDTQGRATSMTYTSGLLARMIDPGARTYQFSYDASSRLAGSTDPAGGNTQFAYDSASNLSQITDPSGNQTRIAYTATHQVSSITYVTNRSTGSGYVENFTYSPGSTVVADVNGNRTTYYYDYQARVTKIVDALGNVTTATYTANSDPARATNPSGGQNTYGYDSLNNPTSVAATNGPAKTASYADNQHPYYPTSIGNTTNGLVGYSYTAAGNVAQRTDPTGHTTTYTYNSSGQPLSATDALGNVTTWQYDAYGNLIKVAYPAPLGPETFTYDSLSRLSSRTDGKGQKTTYSYDSLDRQTLATFADGSSVSASYDADGNTTASTDPTGTTTRSYDPLNRVIKETTPNGQSISYGWDGVGNLTSETDAGGTVTQQFSALNSVTAIVDRQGGKTTVQSNVSAGTQSWTYPNGVTETITSNKIGQVTKVSAATSTGTSLTSFTYGYINPGTGQATALRYSMTDIAGNVTAYSYDSMLRLTGATKKPPAGSTLATYQYSYDPVGNLTSENLNGTATTMSYNGADELTQAGTTTYTYDLAGNETGNSAGLTFSYNALNQTSAIAPPGGAAIKMAYGGIGQSNRVQAGSASFQNDLGGVDSMTIGGATTYFTRLPNSFALSETVANGVFYYLHDALGSVIGLTDLSGKIVNSYDYDPYGNTVTQVESVSNPFRWTGAVWDSATQLYKMGDRYYSPVLARFTQMDPSHQCLNNYSYGADNPINFTDPSGDVFWISCAGSWSWFQWGWGWWSWDFYVHCLFDLSQFDVQYLGTVFWVIVGLFVGGPVLALVLAVLWLLVTGWFAQVASTGFWFVVWMRGHVSWSWPWYWNVWRNSGWYAGWNSWCIDDWMGPCFP